MRHDCSTLPILFNLYINDLLDGLSGIPIRDMAISGLLFADDAIIRAESPQALQNDLGKVES